MLAFSFFRPREKKIYAPKVKYRAADEEDAPPPTVCRYPRPPTFPLPPRSSSPVTIFRSLWAQISNGFFSWLKPLVTAHDINLVDTLGVDAVAFLQFLSLLRWTFLTVSVLTCAVLIPINGEPYILQGAFSFRPAAQADRVLAVYQSSTLSSSTPLTTPSRCSPSPVSNSLRSSTYTWA